MKPEKNNALNSTGSRPSEDNGSSTSSTSRRGFLKTAGLGAAALTATAMLPEVLVQKMEAKEIAPFNVHDPDSRARALVDIRTDAARRAGELLETSFPHPTNGDEERYRDQAFAGNFSKTLPHDPVTGLVVPSAYLALLDALEDGTQAAFDAVPAGGPGKLAGPLSPLQFQIAGSDSPDAKSPFTPTSVASAAGAAEMVEIYWEAYLRDVPFVDYGSNPPVALAVSGIDCLSVFCRPPPA